MVVCVWSGSLRRSIALEVSSREQRLRGAITKQSTITLSYLNIAYNVDRTDRQPVARYLRPRFPSKNRLSKRHTSIRKIIILKLYSDEFFELSRNSHMFALNKMK